MGKIHDRFKTDSERLRTITVDVRIVAAASTAPDTARRMSVFMQDLDSTPSVRYLDATACHIMMQRMADEPRKLGLKGRWNLLCNRTQCLRAPATWYNRGSYTFYCADCARELNRVNARDAERVENGGPLCHNVGSAEDAADVHVMG